MRAFAVSWAIVGTLLVSSSSLAQYNLSAGRSAPRAIAAVPVVQSDGTTKMEQREVKLASDQFGNVTGTQYDLARDGAFDGQTVAVLHLYTGEGFDFHLPTAALKEKGFSVYRWSNGVPAVDELAHGLEKASQLWVISNATPMLSPKHLDVIQRFFEQGHGVYVWGDNDPYYADANAVAKRLVGASMAGNLPGAQVVGLRPPGATTPGLLRDHLVTTGIEQLYEGITIATVTPGPNMQSLLFGSADNLVTSIYEHDGKRAIVDGGFTRLYVHWDTAGTARYVKNAAAWLANAERFGGDPKPQPAPVKLDEPAPRADTVPMHVDAPAPRAHPTRGLWIGALGAAMLAILLTLFRSRLRQTQRAR
jgi:hypothetical protein